MAASDTLAEIHLEMSALDTDLEDLRDSVKSINKTYATVEDSLQMKWKQIRKLDTTERDLNKLQYLSELPNMFKDALTKF
jgi:chromosome segregation ATPase